MLNFWNQRAVVSSNKSSWWPITSGVTGVTRSVNCRVFGNDLNDRSDCTLSKSADHARLGVVDTNVYKYLMEGEIKKMEPDPSKLQTVPGTN